MLTVVLDDGFFNLDSEGVILEKVDFFDAIKPFITGIDVGKAEIGESIKNDAFKKAVLILEILKSEVKLITYVSEINCSDDKNITLFLYNDYNKGVEVFLGGSSFAERLARLEANWTAFTEKGVAIKSIDLRYENQIPVRFREVKISNG